ncbi:glucosaminidase domain-containing protein [Cohnella panacarvi]|uniref:glucosaminidase domain-containing protein n=1 Tax=Cohnella panacarvi TaxID=400776 RepID=UPI00047A42C8|nr:glucosaminidase domain-containing protein [Cohnella panacarvi]
MSNADLLTPSDVNVIRRYVRTKYAPLPGNRQAEIVADAIKRTLRQRLPELPAELNNQLINELIARCLVKEQRVVKADDVLDICTELEANGHFEADRHLDSVVHWVNERVPGRWTAEQLESRLSRSRGLALAAVPVESTVDAEPSQTHSRRLITAAGASLTALAIVGAITIGVLGRGEQAAREPSSTPNAAPVPQQVEVVVRDVGLPEFLQYTDINAPAVKSFLEKRDALLAEEPYFGAIVASAKKHGIHPLLMLAITGQEQGFVPRTNKNAKRIANNPFNVFHSWQDYNTSIQDSSDIAAKLLAKLAAKRPEGADAFDWFNKTYAEDDQWAKGVRTLFAQLSAAERS